MCWKADKREEDEDSVACWPVFNTALQRHGFVSGVLGYLRPASGRDPGLAGLSMWAQVESVVSELSLGIPQRKETTSYRRLFFHRTLSTCKQFILCLSGLCCRDINSWNFEVLLRIKNISERLFKTKVMFLLYMERSYSIEMSKTTRSFGNIGIQIRFGVALWKQNPFLDS